MERLEVKRIKGKEYYYYSKWGWENGKCRRLWQKYLGTSQAIIELAKDKKDDHRKALYAEVFEFGLPVALWKECQKAHLIEIVDKQCPKRGQGLSIGNYIAIAAINRAAWAVSKMGMWEWFSKTSLIRLFQRIKESELSSQRFWDNMDLMSQADCKAIWEELVIGIIDNEKIDISSVSYDGTNYYTFIDTFNVRCSIAKRGKNKQGRADLRQINYALFCTADSQMPLLYDTYEGNRNDFTQFPISLKKFQDFFKKITNNEHLKEKMTLIFDKGNCSSENFKEMDTSEFYFVTSSKLGEHEELASISNTDARFQRCSEDLDRTKAFRIKKIIYKKERTVIVSYNANLFECQWSTLQADIDKAISQLSELRQRLDDRESGLIKKGKAPSQISIKSQCKEILSREYLKLIIECTVSISQKGLPKLEFAINQEKLRSISDTYLGKNIIFTNRENWTNDEIIRAYRSQYIIEEIFKQSKDRRFGTWWPQYHWTDSKIHVHALYCTIALMLRAIMMRHVEEAKINISMRRLLIELSGIREVVNIYQCRGKKRSETVLSKLSEIQDSLATILGLSLAENDKLG